MTDREREELARGRKEARDKMERGQAQGFLFGGMALGALGPQGKDVLPKDFFGWFDFEWVVGGVAWWYSRKGTSKRHHQARGLAAVAVAGAVRDLGASLASRI